MRQAIASLNGSHPHLPWLLRAMARLEEGRLLSGWSRRNMQGAIEDAEHRMETAEVRMGEYLEWRAEGIRLERRRHGLAAQALVHTPARIARRLDEEGLRFCPGCEQVFATAKEERGSVLRQPACPHCASSDGLQRLSEAEAQGCVALDEAGTWRVCHRPVPGWATEHVAVPKEEESQALKRGHSSDYILSGVLRCGRCRKAHVGTAAHGRRNRYRYYVCSARYRYGASFCDGDRLLKDAVEEAVIEQMSEPYRDTRLVGEALALSRAEEEGSSEVLGERLTGVRHELVRRPAGAGSVLRGLRGGKPLPGGLRSAHPASPRADRCAGG